jgi:general stress protein YciG
VRPTDLGYPARLPHRCGRLSLQPHRTGRRPAAGGEAPQMWDVRRPAPPIWDIFACSPTILDLSLFHNMPGSLLTWEIRSFFRSAGSQTGMRISTAQDISNFEPHPLLGKMSNPGSRPRRAEAAAQRRGALRRACRDGGSSSSEAPEAAVTGDGHGPPGTADPARHEEAGLRGGQVERVWRQEGAGRNDGGVRTAGAAGGVRCVPCVSMPPSPPPHSCSRCALYVIDARALARAAACSGPPTLLPALIVRWLCVWGGG